MSARRSRSALATLVATLAGCGGGGTGQPASYTVGGTVTGLSGTVVLQDNAGDDLSVSASGPFTFHTAVASGAHYAVTVRTQPAGQTCSVAHGVGTISSANVTGVEVTCATDTYLIGGNVSGLSGTVVLQNGGGNDLAITANGPFHFSTPVSYGSGYAVTVHAQPMGQACSVANGAGTVSGADVTSVAVTCATNRYLVGGSISGLSGTVVLQDNGGDDLTLTANGPFHFSTPVSHGGAYAVTVLTQPVGQTCAVANDAGTVSGADVTTVAVTCTTITYPTGVLDPAFGTGGVVTSDPGGLTSGATAVARDADSLYVAGFDSAPGAYEWRVEKRTLLDGSLESGFGVNGVIQGGSGPAQALAIAIDGTFMYLAGYDTVAGQAACRIEKRNLADGSLVAGFGSAGVILSSATFLCYHKALAIDSSSMYVAGTDGPNFRVEKRSLADGTLDTSFGVGGVASSYVGGSSTGANAIAIDGTFMYLAGVDTWPGSYEWRIEKRRLSDGALEGGFGSGGAVQMDASSGEDWATSIAIDASSLYVAGYESFATTWRIEKRSLGSGALDTGFGTGGVVQVSSGGYGNHPYGVATDGTSLFAVGCRPVAGTSRLTIERRAILDGSLVSGFGSGGVVAGPASAAGDCAVAVVLDPASLYVVGNDGAPGHAEWHVEKRSR